MRRGGGSPCAWGRKAGTERVQRSPQPPEHGRGSAGRTHSRPSARPCPSRADTEVGMAAGVSPPLAVPAFSGRFRSEGEPGRGRDKQQDRVAPGRGVDPGEPRREPCSPSAPVLCSFTCLFIPRKPWGSERRSPASPGGGGRSHLGGRGRQGRAAPAVPLTAGTPSGTGCASPVRVRQSIPGGAGGRPVPPPASASAGPGAGEAPSLIATSAARGRCPGAPVTGSEAPRDKRGSAGDALALRWPPGRSSFGLESKGLVL